MARPIAADYQQIFLLPPSLEDWLPADHPARFLREFVDALDLPALGFKAQPGHDGRPPYANSLMLKVWLYGLLHKITGLRPLELACLNHVGLIWLTGQHYPDHNSLWRFWRDHKAAVRQLFKASVKLACQLNLVGLVLQAVDGTRIQCASSGPSGWSKEHMEELLAALDAQVDTVEAQVTQEAAAAASPAVRLPADLADREKLRAQVQAGLAQLAQDGRKYYHPHEPEARRTKCEGLNRFAYNAQAVADAQAGIVVAAEVYNQEEDSGLLVPMVEAAQATVGPAQQTVADTGYGAAQDLAAAQAAGLAVVAPSKETGDPAQPLHGQHFTFEAARNVYVCPQGRELTWERQKRRKDRGELAVYRCRHKDCPLRAQCSKDRRGRSIERGPHQALVDQNRQQMKTPQARRLLKQRGVIIEPVFATIKARLGFRRWTVRGLANVRAQWQWLCTAVNLRKLMACWRAGQWPQAHA